MIMAKKKAATNKTNKDYLKDFSPHLTNCFTFTPSSELS